jgi:hypothetical protein
MMFWVFFLGGAAREQAYFHLQAFNVAARIQQSNGTHQKRELNTKICDREHGIYERKDSEHGK